MSDSYGIEIFRSRTGRKRWRFRIVSQDNGQTITTSQAYASRWSLLRTVKRLDLPVLSASF